MSWRTKYWWVSPLNYKMEVREFFNIPDKLLIHDVTLRDGEQQAGLVFSKDEKIELAKLLDEVGVHRIEAGMPSVSDEDMKAIKAISKENLNAKVFSFARCMKDDIDLALKCDVDGVVIEIPSSEHLIKYGYGWSLEKALQLPIEATQYARDHDLYVSFFTIDGTRANINWWFKIIDKVSTEGHMDALAIVDTFGVAIPEAIEYFVRITKKKYKDKPVEIHAHNDFGLAVANTLAAVKAGAEVVHTTINGIGERTGNADLFQVSLALEALYGIKLKLNYEKFYELSKYLEKVTGLKFPPHYPIVGDKIFHVESGIVVSWLQRVQSLKMPLILFPFKYGFTGHKDIVVELGKKSGVANIEYKLNELGISMDKDKIYEILQKVKSKAAKLKRSITDDEFMEMIKEYIS